MITMKLAVLAGGAFVFACVCGASAVVDFDTAPPPAFGTSGCDGWDFGECNTPEPIDGQEVADDWCWIAGKCKGGHTDDETDLGDEISGPGGAPTYEECMISWTIGCDLRNSGDPKPEIEGDQAGVHCFFTEDGCSWKSKESEAPLEEAPLEVAGWCDPDKKGFWKCMLQ